MSANLENEEEILYEINSAKCFICNHEFSEGEEPWLIFENRIDESGNFLNAPFDILSSLLGETLVEKEAHSSVLCDKCNANLLEYSNLKSQLNKLRNSITDLYKKTIASFFNHAEDIQQNITFKDADNDSTTMLNKNFYQQDLICSSTELSNSSLVEMVEEVINEDCDFLITNVNDEKSMCSTVNNLEISPEESVDSGMKNGYVDESASILNNDVVDENIISYEMLENSNSEPFDDVTQGLDDDEIYIKFGDYFTCVYCNNNDKLDAHNFVEHMRSIHNHVFINCKLCPNSFVRQRDLEEHIISDHADKSEFKCTTCERCFSSSRTLRLHKRTHYSYNTKQFDCKYCNKKYSSKNLLDEHVNMHTGQRPFKCSMCTKGFTSKYTLQSHMKIHTDRQRPYQCDQCEKSFLNQQNLKQHKKLHTGVKSVKCNICCKAFSTQHNLNLHMIVHTNSRPFVCRTCGKSFARRPEIKDHERIHSGERPFKCDMCPMAFAQRSNLTSHKKSTHLNEKLHTCTECSRSFKRRRLLDYHIQAVHTGERPHKCNICNAAFVYPEHFKKHMLIHSGRKPFACEICGKQFNSRDNRNTHRFVHSEKKPYECMECGAGFMRKPLLLAHMQQTKHDNDKIIVNQPQFNKTTTKLVLSHVEDEIQVSSNEDDIESYNIEVMSDEKLVESDSITSLIVHNTENDFINTASIDGTVDSQLLKNKLEDIKYLQLADLDNDGAETIPWEDIRKTHH